ncbi:MAG TPA: response regulator [Candidatus Methylomirabilis sp.]|nr:response regulator [Candidatus Methylomirabilis sp.]
MSKRILIVDDEGHIRQMVRLTLETAGYEVGEAADGFQGLVAFGDGSAWDAVLLDQRMPGMDGLETLRRIRERSTEARVIMVTAYASVELAVDAMKLGATDFVRKPMTPEILRNAVVAAVARPMAAQVVTSEPAAEAAVEHPYPSFTRLTFINGFRSWPAPDTPDAPPPPPNQRRFIVQHPEGWQQEVVVEIDPEAIEYVGQEAHHQIPSEDPFWTTQAAHFLNAFLWDRGRIPPGGRLTIDIQGVDRDVLHMASRWHSK